MADLHPPLKQSHMAEPKRKAKRPQFERISGVTIRQLFSVSVATVSIPHFFNRPPIELPRALARSCHACNANLKQLDFLGAPLKDLQSALLENSSPTNVLNMEFFSGRSMKWTDGKEPRLHLYKLKIETRI